MNRKDLTEGSIVGLAMGTTVKIAHTVGAKDKARTSRIIGNTATMFLFISVLLSLVCLFLTQDIVSVIDTPPEAWQESVEYMTVCFIGIPFIMAFNIIASFFRGLGDSKSPMYFVTVACVANILLDFFFIGYMGWGAKGAALGTTLSQMISVLFSLVAIRRHRQIFDVHKHDFRPHLQTIMDMLKIGFPIAMQDGFIQIGFLAITVIANGRGVYDAGAVGIVEKFIGLVFLLPSAMLSTVSAVCSQNIGAGKIDRALTTLRYSVILVRIPFAYLASEMYPDTLFPMGLTTWFGSVFSVVFCIVVYRWMMKHQKFAQLAT